MKFNIPSKQLLTRLNAVSKVISNKNAYAILQKQLKKILDKLPEQEREVISMRFGLDGNGSHTLEEIGMYFNLTREEIRGIESRALRLLRKEI